MGNEFVSIVEEVADSIQDTPLWKIEGAFRKSKLNDDQSLKVRLEFDGDQLDPNAKVQSTDISDTDIIHVYVN